MKPLNRKDAEIALTALGYTARVTTGTLDTARRSEYSRTRYHRVTWNPDGFRIAATQGPEAEAALRLMLPVRGLSYAEALTAVRNPGSRPGLARDDAMACLAGNGYNDGTADWALRAAETAPGGIIFLDRHRVHYDDEEVWDVYPRVPWLDERILAAQRDPGETDHATPGRDVFYEALEEAATRPRTATEHEAAWLREIRNIAASLGLSDAEAGRRIRMLLYPPHLPHDGGTSEGCPGCFPPGEAIGPYRRPDVHDHEEHRDGTVPGCPACKLDRQVTRYELEWLLDVIPVVDQHLDDAAPPEYRDNPLANMWRRFSAGPVSEAAEAIDALNGMTGGNPRKGITHSRTELLAEAADTAFSSLLAIQSQTKDIAATWTIFVEAAAKAYSRVPDEHRGDRNG